MQYIPCPCPRNTHCCLPKKSTFLLKVFQKVHKSRQSLIWRQNSVRKGLKFSSQPKLFGEDPSRLRATFATLCYSVQPHSYDCCQAIPIVWVVQFSVSTWLAALCVSAFRGSHQMSPQTLCRYIYYILPTHNFFGNGQKSKPSTLSFPFSLNRDEKYYT